MPDGPVAVQEMEWQRRVTPKEGANVGERKKAKKDEALDVAQRWRGGFHSSEITGSLFVHISWCQRPPCGAVLRLASDAGADLAECLSN